MPMKYGLQFAKTLMCTSTIGIVQCVAIPSMAAAEDSTAKDRVAITTSLTPSPRVQTTDKAYSARLAGFLQIDYVENNTDLPSFQDGSTVRRARYGVRGTIASDWQYNYMLETGSGDTEVYDVNIAYTGFKNTNVRVGQFKEPLGLEWGTGAPWWTFMDRALLASITPKRSIGASASTGGKNWRVHIAHFTDNTDISKSANEDGATTARLYVSPILQKDKVIHLGFSASSRTPDPISQSVRFKGKHETAMTAKPVLDTGNITDVDKSVIVGMEALGIWGPLSLQGEFVETTVERNAQSNVAFSSFYAQGSWFVTGETRAYKLKKGGFGRVKPNKKQSYGAVELAIRYDTLDLTDRDVLGGSLNRYTAGINWYPTTNLRFSTNYIHADADANSVTGDYTHESILLRAQFAF